MDKFKVHETDAATLDNIWANWNCQFCEHNHVYESYYTDVIRTGQKASRFENWLYEHNAFVIQRNHERFIRFHSEDDAIIFLLRWA